LKYETEHAQQKPETNLFRHYDTNANKEKDKSSKNEKF
jgi:hypothetical protein